MSVYLTFHRPGNVCASVDQSSALHPESLSETDHFVIVSFYIKGEIALKSQFQLFVTKVKAFFVEYVKKRFVLGTKLLWNTIRKPYTVYGMVPLSMTLIDP